MADNSNRGLASADEATRKRVARKGGQASHGGGRQPSGQKGGQTSQAKSQTEDILSSDWASDYEEDMDEEEENKGGMGGTTI